VGVLAYEHNAMYVIPAEAGIWWIKDEIPVFTGMTGKYPL